MKKNVETLKERLNLIAEGILRTQYAEVEELPAHLRQEGLQQRKLYCDMLQKIAVEVSSTI